MTNMKLFNVIEALNDSCNIGYDEVFECLSQCPVLDEENLTFFTKLQPVVNRLCDRSSADQYGRCLERLSDIKERWQLNSSKASIFEYYAVVMSCTNHIKMTLMELDSIISLITEGLEV